LSTFVEGPVAVISPHLDDAVLSLGATIAMLGRHGVPTKIITVLANDPDENELAERWDLRCGFSTTAAAARARRAEDAQACELLGADPIWLPFADSDHCAKASRDTVKSALKVAIGDAAIVLVPGFPLVHPDHAWVAEIAVEETVIGRRELALYREQPYAADIASAGNPNSPDRQSIIHRAGDFLAVAALGQARMNRIPSVMEGRLGSLVERPCWNVSELTIRDWYLKHRAIGAYRSQLRTLRPFLRTRISICEVGARGEQIGWTAVRSHL
jgi:LmbE family N-acetylglucosaminyl deacetylase